MARRSLSRYSGTARHEQDGAKLADETSSRHNQANGFTINPRRSSRLKEIASILEAESAVPVILSSTHQQEIVTDAHASSLNQAKEERPLRESSHGSPKQKSNGVDIIDIDDESYTSITLMDLLTRSKNKKRKASEVKVEANVDIQEHNNGLMLSKEDELDLEETISSLKVKKAKSSPPSEKLNKHTKPTAHSSPVEKRTVLTFPLASAAFESGLDKTALKQTIFNELSVASECGLYHKKENVDEKMKEFAEQNLLSVGSSTAFGIKKEAIETCLDGSDDEKSMMNSSTVFINKCDFENESFGEVLNKVSERKDLEQRDSVISNIMDPFFIDIIKQCKHNLSSSSAPILENCQITNDAVNVKNEHLLVGSTKCESPASNLSLLSTLNRSLSTEVAQKDAQQELQFEELMMSDKRDAHLITDENFTEFVASESKKLTPFLENDGWLAESRKNGFSDMPFTFNSGIVSLVSEFKASYSCGNLAGPTGDSGVFLSLENHGNFVDGLNHGSIDKSNCSGAIDSHKSMDIGGDVTCNMVNENCGELVSQSMQTLSTCFLSQMDYSIPTNDTLVPVDAPCSLTEAGSPSINPAGEDAKQACNYDGDSRGSLMATDYLLDANGRHPQQVRMINRCFEGRPCVKVSNLNDAVAFSGQIVCHCSVPQLHEIEASTLDQINDGISESVSAMDTIADLPTNSSLESTTQICVERRINMQATESQVSETKFGGYLCLGAEHSPRKLLSNRKEISPNSQEKLLRALNNGGLDDVVKLSNCMKKLCFDKEATTKPFSSVIDKGEMFFETERTIKKPKNTNQSLPDVTKGILKSPDTIFCNPCCLKNSSTHAKTQDAILFSQRQMQDTENIATKLLKELNSLRSIVEETIFSEGLTSLSKLNFDEIRSATKHASKFEGTTKKWLAMMAKDCTRFCKIMRLAENKSASPVNDLQKGRKKITFADEAGGALCQIMVYEQQPVAFISPKS